MSQPPNPRLPFPPNHPSQHEAFLRQTAATALSLTTRGTKIASLVFPVRSAKRGEEYFGVVAIAPGSEEACCTG